MDKARLVDTPASRIVAGVMLTMAALDSAQGQNADDRWESLSRPSSMDNRVLCMMEFEGDLIVGGDFVASGSVILNHIGRWDGTQWHPLGEGFNYAVNCLGTYRGSLVVGGSFTQSGERPVAHVARWNGTEWEPVGAGFSSSPCALVEWNGGLVAGGGLKCRGDHEDCSQGGRNAPPSDFAFAAWWDGDTWNALGNTGDESGLPAAPRDLIVYQGSLFAAGSFYNGGSRHPLARWDGSAWMLLGPGIPSEYPPSRPVAMCLAVWDSLLVLGGSFTRLDSTVVEHVVAYDGQVWMPLGSGVSSGVLDLEAHENRLYAVGFRMGLVEWDGSSWNDVASAGPYVIRDIQSHKGILFGAGEFSFRSEVAMWEGTGWRELPTEGDHVLLPQPVRLLASYGGHVVAGGSVYEGYTLDLLGPLSAGLRLHDHHGSEPVWDVYLASPSTNFRGVLIFGGNTWDGAQLGTQPLPHPYWGGIRALTSHRDRLIAAGTFSYQDEVTAVTSWDGETWTPLGEGLRPLPDDERNFYWSQVGALTTYGDQLIAGGRFRLEAYPGAGNIAAWDGVTWSPLGQGPNDLVTCLAVYREDLYAGGFFDLVGQIAVSHIARWDGERWYSLGLGTNGPVYKLETYKDRLIAGGDFDQAGGSPAGSLAAWDGQGWIPLGSGVDGEVLSMTENDGSLYVGGEFSRAGGKTSFHIARWNEGPRMATFSVLSAQRGPEGVEIAAEASSIPFDHQGFLVYRDVWSGGRVAVTSTPIRDQGFNILDPAAPLGPITYWVAGAASTGAVTLYESVQVSADPSLRFAVFPARPNPFRSETTIALWTSREGRVHISVFDLRGRRVRELLDGMLPAGAHAIDWDGRDAAGTPVTGGVYFCRVSGVEGTHVQRLLRLGS